MTYQIDAQGMHYRELNNKIQQLIHEDCQHIVLENVNGQRFIGDAVEKDIKITINGLPGNDLGIFMDGPLITVYANIQDGAANTMNSGSIIVHGNAGDVLGYGMRGGEVYIAGNAGYRAGIHMKEYHETCPALVIGGKAGDFLGEYMAGGLILVLNIYDEPYAIGDYCGSGMHGGRIVIRGDKKMYRDRVKGNIADLNSADEESLSVYLNKFKTLFSCTIEKNLKGDFFKVIADSSRPYHSLYTGV